MMLERKVESERGAAQLASQERMPNDVFGTSAPRAVGNEADDFSPRITLGLQRKVRD